MLFLLSLWACDQPIVDDSINPNVVVQEIEKCMHIKDHRPCDFESFNSDGVNTNLYDLTESKIDEFRGKQIGVVFQNFNLINGFTIKQNLQLANTSSSEGIDHLYNLLQRVGLANKSHIKVSNLSIGEKQRLAVARAFIGNPKWIFCDEPTSSLDDKNSENITTFIKEESFL